MAEQNKTRQIIQAYANNLRDKLADSIGAFFGNADLLPRSVYQPANLAKEDEGKFYDWSLGREPDSVPRKSEDRILKDWLDEKFTEPLLIIAPPGAGKSCLLESLALKLANRLLDERDGWPLNQPLPKAVPFLIPLSRVTEKNLTIEQYLLEGERDLLSTGPLTGREPSLSPELIGYLFNDNRIVLLIDGWDEVPSRQIEFGYELANLKKACRFMLTSRPGHRAKQVVREVSRHRTLQELSSEHARDFVESFFAKSSVGDGVEKFEEARAGQIGHLLSRPLYLKAWCDSVDRHPKHLSPRSLSDLARELLISFFVRRKLFGEIREHSSIDYDAAIDDFSEWLGRLGLLYANAGFEDQKFPLDSVDCDIQWLHARAKRAPNTETLFDIAIKSGLLIRLGDYYFLPKIPVVEYCIGKYLADEAEKQHECPKQLVETFQNWIWRPNLHYTLDIMFDRLWELPKVRNWGHILLEWAVRIGRRDIAWTSDGNGESRFEQDDLIRPFSLTALRWHSITYAPKDEETNIAVEAARNVTAAIDNMLDYNRPFMNELQGPPLGRCVINAWIKSLVGKYSADGEEGQVYRAICIFIVAQRVTANDAVALTTELIDQHRLAASDEKAAWEYAIKAAAGRINAIAAATIVPKWINDRGNVNDEAEGEWRNPIWNAAGRLGEKNAAINVAEWVSQFAAAEPPKKIWWLRGINGMARGIQEQDAGALMGQWLRKLDQAGETNRRGWRAAIEGAAEKLDCPTADRFIFELIERYERATDPTERTVWARVVSKAAPRISEYKAADVADKLMVLFATVPADQDSQNSWLEAISETAARVGDNRWEYPTDAEPRAEGGNERGGTSI